MTARPNAERRQRYKRQLAARDGARCFYCNLRFRDLAAATIDHLVPTYHGGTWARANLVLACEPCNQAKGHRLPTEFLRSRGYRSGLRPSRTAVVRSQVARVVSARSIRRAVAGDASRPAGRDGWGRIARPAALVLPVLLAGWLVTRD